MDTRFYLEALHEALSRYGKPEIFNTDQGSQFTSLAFTGALKEADITISMDGRGRYLNNIFIERLWRNLTYEAVYLHKLMDGFVAERVIGEWIKYYDPEHRHSSLGDKTLAKAYCDNRSVDMIDKADALTTYPQAPQQQDDINLNVKKNWAA